MRDLRVPITFWYFRAHAKVARTNLIANLTQLCVRFIYFVPLASYCSKYRTEIRSNLTHSNGTIYNQYTFRHLYLPVEHSHCLGYLHSTYNSPFACRTPLLYFTIRNFIIQMKFPIS
jgi:hypothetical protein